MDNVPVSDDVRQWTALFTRMTEGGSKAHMNDIKLDKEPVDGVPAPVTGLDGNVQAPKYAGNVLPPREEKPPLPEVYKQETKPVGASLGIDVMGRPKSASRKRKRSSSRKRNASRSSSRRRSTSKKRSTTTRKRANIVRRRK